MTDFRMAVPSGKLHALRAAGQYILNLVGEASRRAADRSRFAALSRRCLDDVGMTPAELGAGLLRLAEIDPRIAPSALAHSV